MNGIASENLRMSAPSSSRPRFPYLLACYVLLPAIIVLALMLATKRPMVILILSLSVLVPTILTLVLLLRILRGHGVPPRFTAEQLFLGLGPAGIFTGGTVVGFSAFIGLLAFPFYDLEKIKDASDAQLNNRLPQWLGLLTTLLYSLVAIPFPVEFAKLVLSYRARNKFSRKGVALSGAIGALGLTALFEAVILGSIFLFKLKADKFSFRERVEEIFKFLIIYPMHTGTGFLLGSAVSQGSSRVGRMYMLAVAFHGMFGLISYIPSQFFGNAGKGELPQSFPGLLLQIGLNMVLLVALFAVCKGVYDKIDYEDSFFPVPRADNETPA